MASEPKRIAAVLLAAGMARRFGADKRRARLRAGSSLLERALTQVAPAVDRVFVTLRPEDRRLQTELLGDWSTQAKVEVVFAPHAEAGMGSSLADGVKALLDYERQVSEEFSGLLVMLADMPYIEPTTITKIVAAHTLDRIVVPCYQWEDTRQWGHPVIFGRPWFAALSQLSGDRGGRSLITGSAARFELEVNDPGVLRDVDRPGDLDAD